jgi:aspartate carbamoyltransferase catalytic subunit
LALDVVGGFGLSDRLLMTRVHHERLALSGKVALLLEHVHSTGQQAIDEAIRAAVGMVLAPLPSRLNDLRPDLRDHAL